jgi:predicted thioesterase
VEISIDMQYLKASRVGAFIQCTATITSIEGRKYTFEIVATDSDKEIIGKAIHKRVIVDIDRFMSKIA